MSDRMMVCLAASPLDWPQGISLLKLWCDLQPAPNPNIDIGIALRYDMDPATVPVEIVQELERRIAKVHIFKSPFVGSGWPHGCNALETGAYQWFVERTRAGDIDADYILMCEPDTVPMRPDWMEVIRLEAVATAKPILGAYFTAEEGEPHINGNCVLHRNFWRECPAIWQCPPGRGWDVYIGKQSLAIGAASRLIWQEYRLGAPDNPWRGDDYLFAPKCYSGRNNPLYGQPMQPAMIHGVKTRQGIEAIRKKFNI